MVAALPGRISQPYTGSCVGRQRRARDDLLHNEQSAIGPWLETVAAGCYVTCSEALDGSLFMSASSVSALLPSVGPMCSLYRQHASMYMNIIRK